MSVEIRVGDCLSVLAEMPDESVHCVVTSPPYWGLRAYQGDTWEGGDPACDHKHDTEHQKQGATSIRKGRANVEAQRNGTFRHTCGKCGAQRTGTMIGLEPTFDEHLANLVAVFREVKRVLRNDGVCFVNYGDGYAGSWGAQSRGNGDPNGTSSVSGGQIHAAPKGTHTGSMKRVPDGLKPKDLMMMPARVAMALQADGWYLRSEIVWHKNNPMPESVTDRPTSAHEKLYLLTKAARYFYDAEAVREPCESGPSDIRNMEEQLDRIGGKHKGLDDPLAKASAATNIGRKRGVGNPSGRNMRNVLTIATAPWSGAHFATFPAALVEPCIKAGTSEKGVCGGCGAPWVREVKASGGAIGGSWHDHTDDLSKGQRTEVSLKRYKRETIGWRPACECNAAVVPATCLDPFAGAGTVGLVADRLQRDAILIEISAEYAEMARRRIEGDAPLFSDVGTTRAGVTPPG